MKEAIREPDFCVSDHAVDQFLARCNKPMPLGEDAKGYIERLVNTSFSRGGEFEVKDNNGALATVVHLGNEFDPALYALLKPNTTGSAHSKAVVSILTSAQVNRSVSEGGKWHGSIPMPRMAPGIGLVMWVSSQDDTTKWERYPNADKAVDRANQLLRDGKAHTDSIEIYRRVPLETSVQVTVSLKDED